MEPRYPDVSVQLTGDDSNIFYMLGKVVVALERSGIAQGEVDALACEVNQSDSYDVALSVLTRWVHVS